MAMAAILLLKTISNRGSKYPLNSNSSTMPALMLVKIKRGKLVFKTFKVLFKTLLSEFTPKTRSKIPITIIDARKSNNTVTIPLIVIKKDWFCSFQSKKGRFSILSAKTNNKSKADHCVNLEIRNLISGDIATPLRVKLDIIAKNGSKTERKMPIIIVLFLIVIEWSSIYEKLNELKGLVFKNAVFLFLIR